MSRAEPAPRCASYCHCRLTCHVFSSYPRGEGELPSALCQGRGQGNAMVPAPALPLEGGAGSWVPQEPGARGPGGAGGEPEDTTAGASCSPLPSGLSGCCCLFLEHSSLPLMSRGAFPSPFCRHSGFAPSPPPGSNPCLPSSGVPPWFSHLAATCLLTICSPCR